MADAQQSSSFSRRKALLAGVGLVAAGAAGGLVTTRVVEGGLPGTAKDSPKAPVMVHLRDARTGEFDVFVGNEKVALVDTNFAAKLVQAAANVSLES